MAANGALVETFGRDDTILEGLLERQVERLSLFGQLEGVAFLWWQHSGGGGGGRVRIVSFVKLL